MSWFSAAVSDSGVGGGVFMTGGGFTSLSEILLGEILMSSFRWLLLVYSV